MHLKGVAKAAWRSAQAAKLTTPGMSHLRYRGAGFPRMLLRRNRAGSYHRAYYMRCCHTQGICGTSSGLPCSSFHAPPSRQGHSTSRVRSECRRLQGPGSRRISSRRSNYGAVGIFCARPSLPLWTIRLSVGLGGRRCCQLGGTHVGHSGCQRCGGGRSIIGSSSWRKSKSPLQLRPLRQSFVLLMAAGEQLKERLRHHCGSGPRYCGSLVSALEPLHLRQKPPSSRCEAGSFGWGP